MRQRSVEQGSQRPSTVAYTLATFLARSGVERIYGLTGGHIKPLWDEASRLGIEIVDVRHEAAAVHMAQAEADLTGSLAVATVTTGPGFTNAVTGLANAMHSRSSVLLLSGVPPRPQLGLGAVEELPQVEVARPLTRLARTVTHQRQLLPFLHNAFSAAVGDDGPPGPAYLDFPTDLLREPVVPTLVGPLTPASRTRRTHPPDLAQVESAAAVLRQAKRPLLIGGKAAARDPVAVQALLAASGALYLDTGDSRGAVPVDHPSFVPAMRSRVMADADVVLTLGRHLDFSLAYGSRAVFQSAPTFVRFGRSFEELSENRVADVEVRGDVPQALRRLAELDLGYGNRDTEWLEDIRTSDRQKRTRLSARWSPDTDAGGPIHPQALIEAVNRAVAGKESLLVADGGDILSFARVGLRPAARLDPGSFGCLGTGVPFAVAASLTYPDRTVVAVVGDGAFGFNAMELDTARRSGARPVVVVSNNSAWNIERIDQVENFGGNVFGTELPGCRYDLLAESLGIASFRVTELEQLEPALRAAIDAAPALVDVQVTGDPHSPDFLGGLAEIPDLHALRTWNTAELALLDEED